MINVESEKTGLDLNLKRTETMVVSKKTVTPESSVMLNETMLKRVNRCNRYLHDSRWEMHNRNIQQDQSDKVSLHTNELKCEKYSLTNRNFSISVRPRAFLSLDFMLACGREA